MITHTGGCHCGRVRFEVDAPAELSIDECNCSMCARTAYLHLIVTGDRFRISRGKDALTTYTFNTGTAKHLFCATCGIKPFYVPRSHPDGWSVNARCIDSGTVTGMKITPIDGRNWENSILTGAASSPCEDVMSQFAENIRPFVDAELAAAQLDPAREFAHLERAHVLGQASTREHVRVHWHMLLWAWRHRNPREFLGQSFRLIGAATKTFIGLVPAGNTGGANVSPIRPMPVDPELAAIIEKAQGGGAGHQKS